jgi:hypothetical protein
MRASTRFLLILAVGLVLGLPQPASASGFWDLWKDGQAEVALYDLTQPRYGQARAGQAQLVWVAEPLTRSTRVKPDPGKHPDSDIFYVLKLNHLRKFQTGVYPYSVMTSTFTHVDPEGSRPRGAPAKVTFSSQEWCGQVFHQLLFDEQRIRQHSFSYFDGEAEQSSELAYPAQALVGDNLLTAARGQLGELVTPGQRRELPYLPTLMEVRLLHRPLAWSRVSVERDSKPRSVEVPAGRFQVDSYLFTSPGRPDLTVWVEAGGDRRIIGWIGSDGERAVLRSSQRMEYWKLNKNGDEKLLGAPLR